MRLKILFFLSILAIVSAISPAFAQTAPTDIPPTLSGYQIKFTSDLYPDGKLYLIGYRGGVPYCVDSAVIKKGSATFKRKSSLPCGVYSLSRSAQSRPFADIILNKDHHLSITLANQQIQIAGSEENTILYNYIYSTGLDHARILQQSNELAETMPDAFVSKFLMAVNGADYLSVQNSRSPQAMLQQYLSVTDLSEPRLLYAPIPLFALIDQPITKEEIVRTDSVIAYIQKLITANTAANTRDFLTAHLFALLDVHNPEYDPALLFLYDNYDRSWIPEGNERRYERKINNIRRVSPGTTVPELISHDLEGNAHSNRESGAKYTVLWFWDPDCDHCQEMTPVLHQLFVEHSSDLDFDVFAVEVNEDYDRWKAFSDQHELWDWTNLSTSRGEANIDFIEYFDIVTTPVMFLIDNTNHHTIIARQLTLEELSEKLNELK